MLSAHRIDRLEHQYDRLKTVEASPTLGELYGMFLGLPMLRAFWPMSSVSGAAEAIDLSGQGRHLAYNGNPVYAYYNDCISYIGCDGTGDYLSISGSAGLIIVGNETSVYTPQRGLTFGGWFYASALTGIMQLIGRGTDAAAATDSYLLRWRGDAAGDPLQLVISDGANYDTLLSTLTIAQNQWYYVVGRFVPSTSIDLFVSGQKTTNTTGIPATLNNAAIDFRIGANAAAGELLNGNATLCFVCAAALSDAHISYLYNRSAWAFQ
jgi:hypothetical protein